MEPFLGLCWLILSSTLSSATVRSDLVKINPFIQLLYNLRSWCKCHYKHELIEKDIQWLRKRLAYIHRMVIYLPYYWELPLKFSYLVNIHIGQLCPFGQTYYLLSPPSHQMVNSLGNGSLIHRKYRLSDVLLNILPTGKIFLFLFFRASPEWNYNTTIV